MPRLSLCFLLQPVNQHDDHKERKGNDDEINQRIDKETIVQRRRSRRLGCREAWIGSTAEINEQSAEIHIAHRETQVSRQHVTDKRTDDLPASRADHYTDGHIRHVAAHGEFLEFSKHERPPFCYYGV